MQRLRRLIEKPDAVQNLQIFQDERRLRADRESGGSRPFVKATFDHQDGHIVHYVHSVMKTHERLEITVTLRPLAAPEGQPQSER